jgi:hypothetical protein
VSVSCGSSVVVVDEAAARSCLRVANWHPGHPPPWSCGLRLRWVERGKPAETGAWTILEVPAPDQVGVADWTWARSPLATALSSVLAALAGVAGGNDALCLVSAAVGRDGVRV